MNTIRCTHCGETFCPDDRGEGPLACPACGNRIDPDTAETVARETPLLPPEDQDLETDLDGFPETEVAPQTAFDASGALRGEGKGPVRIGVYRVLRELGKGGMGVVYLAEDENLGRKAAVKVLPPTLATDREFVERFRREAASASKLEHPGIVQVFGVGEDQGMYYLAMQYVEGTTLRDADLSIRDTARIGKAVAEALAFAHDRGVIHRDVKPENIMLRDADGLPLIMDFGLAREESSQGLTQSGQVLGTPAYMSPEQARGLKDVGGASDQYSLGASLYELLTDTRVFDAPDLRTVLFKVISEDPVPLRRRRHDVPRDLEVVVLKCLEKNSDARYASCAELAADLGRFLDGEPIHARPVRFPTRLARKVRKRPLAFALAGLLAVALTVSGLLAFHAGQESQRVRKEMGRQYTEAMEAGRDAFEAGRFDEAVEAFASALILWPDDEDALAWRNRARASGLVERGEKALEDGAWEAAHEAFTEARRLDPGRAGLSDLLRRAARVGVLAFETGSPPGDRAVTLALSPAGEGGPGRDHRFEELVPRLELPEGIWKVDLRVEGCLPLRFPVRVEAGDVCTTRVALVDEKEAPEGMVFVPGGRFLFGDMQAGGKEVSLGPYFIDEREVTREAYRAFVEEARDDEERAWRTPSSWKDGTPEGDPDLPVTGVTWEQAYEYARWAGKHLPSAREWEKAARGVDGRVFPWGNGFDRSICNSPAMTEDKPVAASLFRGGASPYGALNMAGNVAEWTASEAGEERNEFGEGRIRVAGGSWVGSGPDDVKTYASRILGAKDAARDVGFRCARFWFPARAVEAPRAFGAPAEVDAAVEFRARGTTGLGGWVRLVVRNERNEPMDAWSVAMPYFTRIHAARRADGRPLPVSEASGNVFKGRPVTVRFDPPLPANKSEVVFLQGESTLAGNPSFLKRWDRFRASYTVDAEEVGVLQVRLVLPPRARVLQVDPGGADERMTDRGLEIFWTVSETEAVREEIFGQEEAQLVVQADYRLEGVDLRIPEADAFIRARKEREDGAREMVVEKELEKYSRDYGNAGGATYETLRKVFMSQGRKYTRIETHIDFRSVEFYGAYAVSVESTTGRVWDKSGGVAADGGTTLTWVVHVREDGVWKRLSDRTLRRIDMGTVGKDEHTYVNERYKCRLGPAPGWSMEQGKVQAVFHVALMKAVEGKRLFVVFGGQPVGKGLKEDEFFEMHVRSLEAALPDVAILAKEKTELGGHGSWMLDFRYVSKEEGEPALHTRARRYFVVANGCVYMLSEHVSGPTAEEADRAFESNLENFEAVRRTIKID